ncbi:hypothetical protein [Microvirga sesbaniae]|uniref:hypothetical protein n=1 Tax=Microvirga sesbaniae TaxID=681392 RepID=UPI0021CA1D2B|nr:hypothetical protein [Microvirga sp. HBU67692]
MAGMPHFTTLPPREPGEPYTMRERLDPGLLNLAIGPAPDGIGSAARLMGISRRELLLRCGHTIRDARDALHAKALRHIIDSPLADPAKILSFNVLAWQVAGREAVRHEMRVRAADRVLTRLLGVKRRNNLKGRRSPGPRTTSTGTSLRLVPKSSPIPEPSGVVPVRPRPIVWSLADIEAAASLLRLTIPEWQGVLLLRGGAASEADAAGLKSYVSRRLLERVLSAFRGHKSPRVRLIAGRVWLSHQADLNGADS